MHTLDRLLSFGFVFYFFCPNKYVSILFLNVDAKILMRMNLFPGDNFNILQPVNSATANAVC